VNEPGDYFRTLGGVRVFQWNPVRGADEASLNILGNFGDLLGPLIVERMLWRRLPIPREQPPQPHGSRLFSIGSVMHVAQAGDVVWGAGVNGKVLPSGSPRWPALDVRAVRGPWTARLLVDAGIRVPCVFGDPVLLVGRLLPELHRWERTKVHDTLVVPNFNDLASFEGTDYNVLAPTEPVSTVLKAVAQSRFVVGSSLHAVGVADALGVPARFVVSSHEDPFKYRDYLAGTDRPTARIADSVEHALVLGPHRPPDVDLDALERAFPWDMWGLDSDQATVTPPEFLADTMQNAWLERIAQRGDASSVVRHFLEELVPQVRDAAIQGTSDFESLVDRAAAYLTHVAPEAATEQIDGALRRLVDAIETRDMTRARLAAVLCSSPSLAMLRGTRVAGRHLIVSVVVHYPPTFSAATHVELVLTGQSTGSVVRQPVTLFALQRTQWHVDLEMLVDLALLSRDDAWTMAVAIDGPSPELLDVLSAPSEALDMVAVERGNLPVAAPVAAISDVGTEVPATQPLQVRFA
jgi:hypothetical protein